MHTNYNIMIRVKYDNPELKSLIKEGKSTVYKEIVGKKGFLKSLHGFIFLLRILHQ